MDTQELLYFLYMSEQEQKNQQQKESCAGDPRHNTDEQDEAEPAYKAPGIL